MFRLLRRLWFWLAVGVWPVASTSCGPSDDAAGAVGPSGEGGSAGEGPTANGGVVGELAGQGGMAGNGGEPTFGGAGGQPGGSAGAGGTAGILGCQVGQRAATAAATYEVDGHALGIRVCALQSGLSCYPGDQQCSDGWDWATSMAIDSGCIPEDSALCNCLVTLTADGFGCNQGDPVQNLDVCVTEQAAQSLCLARDADMLDQAREICALQAGLACYAGDTPCANGIRADSTHYGNIGCGAVRERLLLCLAGLSQYDFECSLAGGVLAPAVKQPSPCEAEQRDLDNCACPS